jgi:hypothetical protein
MNTRWKIAASTLLGAAVLVGSAGVAGAELITINVPAPVSQAEGIAANVGGVVGIGHTTADATPTSGDAVANAVEIGGKAPLAVLGSTQNGPGHTANSLLDTHQTPLGRVEVAPSSATVTDNGNTRQSDAAAALLRGNLFDPSFASIDVLQSQSVARHSGGVSDAFATSDALVLNFGGPDGTTLRLLHSESSSSGKGLTYIISINDHPIVSVTDVADKVCSLDLPEVLQVSCLDVTGGVGSVTSQVLDATVGGVNGLNATAIKASGSGGVGGSAVTNLPATPPDVQAQSVTRGSDTARGLARTGTNATFLAAAALALMALGMVLIGMKRTTAPAIVRIK